MDKNEQEVLDILSRNGKVKYENLNMLGKATWDAFKRGFLRKARGEETPEGLEEEVDEPQARGQLTNRILKKSKELLGYEICVKELRLMPYIIDVMINNQKIEPIKINRYEREILSKWRTSGHIEGGASGLQITEEFWCILTEIVRLGYVDIN